LTDLVNNHEYAIEQIKEWTDKKNVMRDSIISMLQSENVKYVTINNKKVAVDTVIRKATPEKVVAAKPETSHTKLTIRRSKMNKIKDMMKEISELNKTHGIAQRGGKKYIRKLKTELMSLENIANLIMV
jgi:hypothetical protein